MLPQEMAEIAIACLDDNKAINITNLDVTSLTDVTDRIIVCTATSKRHASALTDKVVRKLRESGVRSLGTQGENTDDGWVLVDFADIVVHIMLAEAREFYSLEKLWSLTEATRDKAVGEN